MNEIGPLQIAENAHHRIDRGYSCWENNRWIMCL
jgi:hypothetical protein